MKMRKELWFGFSIMALVVLSAIAMPEICESFSQRATLYHLSLGRVVIFAGGTGNPFFTTDSAAALRAAEMGAEAIFKGTQVDGIYSAYPNKDPTATRFDRLTHSEVLEKGLAVMDVAAVALANRNARTVWALLFHHRHYRADHPAHLPAASAA